MRTEQEMYDLILKVAEEDERIRAVYIDGSRTNPNAPRDIFQDYDVGYVVRETESFRKDRDWTERMFGKILYMQRPDEFAEFFPDEGVDPAKSYGWLMQFADGNRIDLHVETIANAQEGIFDDTLRKILLDKDGILPEVPESNDSGYFVKKPAQEEYICACNEFWWCLNNVAKGLWRGEMTYVQHMVNHVVRIQLEKLLSWKVGLITDWSVSVGKSGKYMNRWLPEKDWTEYLSTWFSCDVKEAWEAAGRMCALFDRTAKEVGAGLGYEYNQTEAENSFSYFRHVRMLPADAEEVYTDVPEDGRGKTLSANAKEIGACCHEDGSSADAAEVCTAKEAGTPNGQCGGGSNEIQRKENTDFEIISLDEAGREEIENRLDQYDVQYISYRLNGGAAVGIAKDGRLIAGAIGYMSAFHILYVGTVFVDEEYRRRGIGTMLMAEVERRALALGADTIRLDTFNWQGRDFYKACGFEEIGRYEHCEDGFSEHFFMKRLTKQKTEEAGGMQEKLHTGELYLPNDEEIMKEQVVYQDRLCEYNRTKPSEAEKRTKMLKEMLADCGEGVYIEAPFYSNFGGHHCHFGKMVYANYHLTCVDDTHIYIGDYTMIGPNVTIATAGHPILPKLREQVYQYNMPVHIGRNCWLGAGAVIMPGVTIGDNTVIGAGSVVTKDIPANVVAVGNPCRVMREINEHDREYYYKDRKIVTGEW